MTESEARTLEREVIRTPPWIGWLNPAVDKQAWWVNAHHPSMRQMVGRVRMPLPFHPLTSREDWLEALAKWGKA